MKRRQTLQYLLLIALVIIFPVAMLVYVAKTSESAGTPRYGLQPIYKVNQSVVYVTKDIAKGEKLTGDALQTRFPQEADAGQDTVVSTYYAEGMTARRAIAAGETLHRQDLESSISPGGL